MPSVQTASSGLAVLFADVSGSTRLYETLGDERALATIARCLSLVREACDSHAGRVIKTIGDEAMAVFAAADDAALAAAAMQSRITDEAEIASRRLAIRVGFHFGPALEADGDVFGDSVNVAARLVGVAHAAQVITSAATAAALSPWLRVRTRELTALTVKGKLRDMNVFELLWQDSADELTTISTRIITPIARLRVRHGTREIMLGEWQALLGLGRDAQNDVVIADRMASRMHAHIERRRDRFVLVDHSSNGTFLTIEGEPEIPLRREEFILRGKGHISFGHAYAKDPSETVEFFCGG
jgi:class 3 adenylate cyclase